MLEELSKILLTIIKLKVPIFTILKIIIRFLFCFLESIQDLNERINQLTALESKFQSAILDSQRDLIKEISNLRSSSSLIKSGLKKYI